MSYIKTSLWLAMLIALAGAAYVMMTKRTPTAPGIEPKIRVVNVLDKAYYDDAHITGSIHVDYGDLMEVAATWSKETPVVVYCANPACLASSEGARELKKLGFKDVRAYEGGTAEWYQLAQQDPSYRITGPALLSYLKQPIGEVPHSEGVTTITAAELKELLRQSSSTVTQDEAK